MPGWMTNRAMRDADDPEQRAHDCGQPVDHLDRPGGGGQLGPLQRVVELGALVVEEVDGGGRLDHLSDGVLLDQARQHPGDLGGGRRGELEQGGGHDGQGDDVGESGVHGHRALLAGEHGQDALGR